MTVWVHFDGRDRATPGRLGTSILPPEGVAFDIGLGVELSPDGTKIGFAAARVGEAKRLWIRDLGRTTARVLEGTDDASAPFWSPDGKHIGFFAGDALKKINLGSGLVETILNNADSSGAAWTPDGRIVLSAGWGKGLSTVSASGGPVTELFAGGSEVDQVAWPSFLPDGNHFLYLVRGYGSELGIGEVRIAALDGSVNKHLLD